MRTMLKSKIHRARVTGCNVGYEGSITVDKDLVEAADLFPYEQVNILNVNNGARFHTYVLEGERGSGEICLNGAAARLVAKGDIVIILSYQILNDDEATTAAPTLVYVNSENHIIDIKADKNWTRDLLSTV